MITTALLLWPVLGRCRAKSGIQRHCHDSTVPILINILDYTCIIAERTQLLKTRGLLTMVTPVFDLDLLPRPFPRLCHCDIFQIQNIFIPHSPFLLRFSIHVETRQQRPFRSVQRESERISSRSGYRRLWYATTKLKFLSRIRQFPSHIFLDDAEPKAKDPSPTVQIQQKKLHTSWPGPWLCVLYIHQSNERSYHEVFCSCSGRGGGRDRGVCARHLCPSLHLSAKYHGDTHLHVHEKRRNLCRGARGELFDGFAMTHVLRKRGGWFPRLLRVLDVC